MPPTPIAVRGLLASSHAGRPRAPCIEGEVVSAARSFSAACRWITGTGQLHRPGESQAPEIIDHSALSTTEPNNALDALLPGSPAASLAAVDSRMIGRHWRGLPTPGEVAEWLKAADCKSARASVRWFESSPLHHSARATGAGLSRNQPVHGRQIQSKFEGFPGFG